MPIFPSGGGSGSGVTKRSVLFDASSGAPVILQADGVSSITDNGTGDFTINFTAMPTDDYVALLCGRADPGLPHSGYIAFENHDFATRTTTALRIYTIGSDFTFPRNWPINSVLIMA